MDRFVKILLTCSLCEVFGIGIIVPAEGQSLTIGQEYQGGYIFFVDSTGKHGLIVAPVELCCYPLLYRTEKRVEGASGIEIGNGFTNTVNILKYCNFVGETAPYYCATFTNQGYAGWFLPSIDELEQLYSVKESIKGGFRSGYYWSSSVAGQFYGWARSFYEGDTRLFSPYARLNVRPVRAF